MADQPAIFVTRKLPDAVTARLLRDYDAHPQSGRRLDIGPETDRRRRLAATRC